MPVWQRATTRRAASFLASRSRARPPPTDGTLDRLVAEGDEDTFVARI